MSDLELLLACLMIPAAYVIIYVAGKYDMVTMICKMLESKCKKIAAQADAEPTAYDPEKVIKELEKETIALEDNFGELVECIPKNIAIDIVKRGATNDN